MSQKGHNTCLAGEFYVMSQLFRLEHEASITLRNAKSIDILTKSPKGNHCAISVKSIRGGGKWGIGSEDDYSKSSLVFVLLHFNGKKFLDLKTLPDIWVVPAHEAQKIKQKWHKPKPGQKQQYRLSFYKKDRHLLDKFRDAWHYLA
ncbi:MAG: hypothetical protein Q8P48_06615 [Deltaproteobacteria bacterium]|nr:hypothetical protein [Deltaproteobacteria bacterium]